MDHMSLRAGRRRSKFGASDHRSERRRGLNVLKAENLEERSLMSVFIGPLADHDQPKPADVDPASPPAAVADLGVLADVYAHQVLGRNAAVPVNGLASVDPANLLSFDSAGRVGVRLRSDNLDALTPTLTAAGFKLAGRAPADPIIEGYLPVTQLPVLQQMLDQGAAKVGAMYKPLSNATANEADIDEEAARVRNTPAIGVTGADTATLVISDSFNRKGGYATDQATGDLPAGVVVVDESDRTSPSDEGRAMAQLVHDIAPDTQLFFHTADSQAALAAYIDPAGASFGADAAAMGITRVVGVDDFTYFDSPFFEDSILGKAVDAASASYDLAYFSSAGNHGDFSYQNLAGATFGVLDGHLLYDFDPTAGVDRRQSVTLPAHSSTTVVLQWDDRFGAAEHNLDLFVSIGGTRLFGTDTDNLDTGDPVDILGIQNSGNSPVTFDLEIQRTSQEAGAKPIAAIKYIAFGRTLTVNDFATHSSTIFGHNAAKGAFAVAAAPFFDQTKPESFTSTGPTQILFDASGTPISEVRQTPQITGVDGTSTSVPGFSNFFGTSAAAPNVAAVAALMLQKGPMEPADLFKQLTDTADDIHTPGTDNVTGHGLVNAFDALYFDATNPLFVIPGEAVKRASVATSYSDSFESGALGFAWETHSNGGGRIQAQTLAGTTNGSKALILDSFGVGIGSVPFALNEATLHFDATTLPGGAPLILSFDQREGTGGDEDDPLAPVFSGSVNGDGVALSVDGGATWHTLVSLTGADSGPSFQSKIFDLKAFATANSLTLGSDVRIKFQQYDNSSLEADGMVFDQVALSTKVSSTTAAAIKVNPNETQAPNQRSRVTELSIDVNGTINANAGTAVSLKRLQDNATVTLVVKSIAPTPGDPTKTRLLLCFSGPQTEFGSLKDGDYKLTLSGLTDANGLLVDTDSNGTPGGPALTKSFFRFFGDSDGDRDVDGLDLARFAQSHTGANAAIFLSFFDFNQSGPAVAGARHDGLDLANFMTRVGKKLAPPPLI
jgi:Subtilase family